MDKCKMHIPDGFLDLLIALFFIALSGGFEYKTFKKINTQLTEKIIPQTAIVTAAIFVAQMLNFPILAGTSGHLVGGTLLAILFGPWNAIFSMTIIIVIQAFVFSDGGIIVIGANLFNMAIITPLIGYYSWKAIQKILKTEIGNKLGIAVGAWLSIVVAAIICGLQLGLSAIFPFSIYETIPAMAFWYILIGIGESIITVSAFTTIQRLYPEMITSINGE